jgi:hypothetical protein
VTNPPPPCIKFPACSQFIEEVKSLQPVIKPITTMKSVHLVHMNPVQERRRRIELEIVY